MVKNFLRLMPEGDKIMLKARSRRTIDVVQTVNTCKYN